MAMKCGQRVKLTIGIPSRLTAEVKLQFALATSLKITTIAEATQAAIDANTSPPPAEPVEIDAVVVVDGDEFGERVKILPTEEETAVIYQWFNQALNNHAKQATDFSVLPTELIGFSVRGEWKEALKRGRRAVQRVQITPGNGRVAADQTQTMLEPIIVGCSL